ncbi:hypothetical protein E2C01_058593 [Portunus trituberculatus]|uniref:Uncharacterized protein n=1 Tax=Portunus trituberculatus TaxID=210409 RepID=A0A5B7H3L4_PORTR|nr:hypothetical protein [Portunus trituberculatus]
MAVLERGQVGSQTERERCLGLDGDCPVKVQLQSMNRTEELFAVIGADSLQKTCQDKLPGKWIRWSLLLGHKVRR